MQSKAKTVAEYLDSLPDDRREAIAAVRDAIRSNLDPEFEERMSYGMIGYCVPHSIYPKGYHCDSKQPLPYACLASQKNHMSLYLMTAYDDCDLARWLRSAWKAAGKKLDMGKCCIRFKRLDDVPLEVVGEAVRRVPARAWVAYYESVLDPRTGKPRSSRPAGGSKAKGKTKVAAKAAARGAKAKSPSRSRQPVAGGKRRAR